MANMNMYQREVEGFMNPETLETKKQRMNNALFGLAGEVGECCDLWKKHVGHGHELDREKFKKEAGDVFFYLAELASCLDCTLEEIALLNLDKLLKRYPTGKFTVEDSIAKKDQMEYKVLPLCKSDAHCKGLDHTCIPEDYSYILDERAENQASELTESEVMDKYLAKPLCVEGVLIGRESNQARIHKGEGDDSI